MERKFLPVSIALLTVSDTRVFETDKSGNLLANKIEQSGHILFERKIVKDEILDIQEVSKKWIKKPNVEVIISTGGMLAGMPEIFTRCHLVPSIGGQPPRSAFGHIFSRQLGLLREIGALPKPNRDTEQQMIDRLKEAEIHVIGVRAGPNENRFTQCEHEVMSLIKNPNQMDKVLS